MKFVLVLCFVAGLIATLQAAAVDNEAAQPKTAEADSTTVGPTEASDALEDISYPECHQPKVTGRCFALFYRYAYNAENRQCEEFIYGGCNGNKNNFESKEDCEKKCMPKSNDAAEDKDEESSTPKEASDEEEAPVVPPVDVKPAVAA